MKNTTFRKKALLSSVAMLLVALVALGSATFAWFTANDTVNATGLAVKSSAADGLKIAKTALNGGAPDAADYAQSVTIDDMNGQTWAPVSPILESSKVFSMYNGSASAIDSYALDSKGATLVTAGYYAYDLWLKAENGASTVTVTATFGGDDEALLYARAALIDAETGAVSYLAAAEQTNKKLGGTGNAKFETDETVTATAGTVLTANTSIKAGSQYHLYVWFEGQDEDCKDANANANLTLDLSFTKA